MSTKNIVILGAGYGGLKVTQRLSDLLKTNNDYRIILINKHNFHMFMTQLHESAIGTSEFDDVSVSIPDVLKGKNIEFIKGWVEKIDLKDKIVVIDKGKKTIKYFYLIVALGSEPEYYNIPGLKEYSKSLRSLYSSLEIRRHIELLLKEASMKKTMQHETHLTFVVGGGGLTGVEFAGELAHQLEKVSSEYKLNHDDYKIFMVEGAKELLPDLANEMGEYTHKTLSAMGVKVITEDFIKEVTHNTIRLASGRQINYSLLVWAGGIKGNRVLKHSGFQVAARGRVPVNQFLEYTKDQFVYLVGDNALAIDPKTNKPVLPTAQSALHQGEIVAYNVYADINNLEKKTYQPTSIGTLISIGRGKGLGEVKTFKIKGSAASWIKKLVPIKYRYSLGGIKMLTTDFLTSWK